ncbi:MAG: 30S ribosomal protein S5, partial [Bdellovibrionales bacterium]|nr:30S ribosomal protein S5 [Bdellovibrionales bacterium]
GEVPNAIAKGGEQAKKQIVKVPLVGTTVPHETVGSFGPTRVVIKPGKPGTGVIAGSATRAIMEAAGVKDVRTKVLGSNNPSNVLQATMNGLLSLKRPEEVGNMRGLALEQIGYSPF